MATFARVAEQCGYSGIAFTDHPAPTVRWTQAGGEGSADPLVSLAYCAAVTHAIELMTFVLVLPYRNPFLLAHQVNTLDALSGGRVTLGLGTGYLKGEMRALGVNQGWDAGAMAGAAHSMAEVGVGTLFVTVCGDDPSAANDTLVAFGEQVVAVVKEQGADPAGSAPAGPDQYRVST
jgi:hypothetical protein